MRERARAIGSPQVEERSSGVRCYAVGSVGSNVPCMITNALKPGMTVVDDGAKHSRSGEGQEAEVTW